MIFVNPNPAIPTVPFRPDLADVLSAAPNQPIALFPVRLETRYFVVPTGGFELRVRVYPDTVHIDTHEPGLTDQERLWGKHFWEQTWRAAGDDAGSKAAWQQLAERFGAQRAAWVARSLSPLNPAGDRPTGPVADGVPLPKPINFPAPESRDDAWTRAPKARVLPTRWYVLGYAGGALTVRAVGNVISPDLAMGPDPRALLDESRPPNPEELSIDPGMKWLIDFDEAERVGMGIRLKLTTDQALQGFDILMVVGTNTAQTAADSTQRIADLLDAHHFTDGLGFILNGTPSNNTPDGPSGYSARDLGQEGSYAAERTAAAVRPGDGSNADLLATALGLRDGQALAVANVANATSLEQRDARHMNRALWAATLGYYLPQMLGVKERSEMSMTPADFKWARGYFIDYVRAAGPLPAIRVGRQPYGVLPVTSLTLWKPKTGQEALYARDTVLKDALLQLRELWRRNLSQVPRIGRSGNPDSDLADVFALDGLSSSYAIRHLFGFIYLQNVWMLLFPVITSTWFDKRNELTNAAIRNIALPGIVNPRLFGHTFTGYYRKLNGPAIQAGALSETATLQPNYIDLLLNAPSLDVIRNESFQGPAPRALLYALLRHSLMLEYWHAAANLSQAENTPGFGWQLTREQEFTTAAGDPPTFWMLMNRPIDGITTIRAADFLHTLRTSTDPNVAPRVAPLFETRESLAHLQTLSTGRLQRAFAGTLDLCSHRLDAWFTSFATRRLAEIRAAAPAGTLVGGYGWVMNLKPAPAPAAVEVTPPGERGVVLRAPNNPGFTHTPSLAQAATAAVLRSAHLTHANTATQDLLAIDLSSERVRLASWLLDGVRQGQPLGALLGYRFERRLHDARLDLFIAAFREVAPIAARKLPQTTIGAPPQSVESIAANNVVDGLVLQRLWKTIPRSQFAFDTLQRLFALGTKPLSQQAQQMLLPSSGALFGELEQLDAAVDAVSDALMAETVHHAVQGNPLRTASTLDAVASGEAPPPELTVVATPRTGFGLTYRLVTLFGGSPAMPAKWPPPPRPYRLVAEPYLSAWAGRLLGDPTAVRCVVERVDESSGAVVETREMRLADLKLGSLDLIYANEGSRDAAPSEIEQRIIYATAKRAPAIPDGAILRLNPARQPAFAATDVSYAEFVEVLRTARRLITSARGIDASDLNLPGQNQPAAIDLAELTARADRGESVLRGTQTVLSRALTTATTTIDALRDAIFNSAVFAIPGAIPFSAVGDTPLARATLVAQGTSVVKELAQRADQLTELKKGVNLPTATAEELRDLQLARLRAAFGKGFVVLPRFTAANALELEKALADSAKIQDGDTLAAATWFQRASRVREGVSRLDASLRYAESLETGEKLTLRVAQLPWQANDRWIALPLKPGQPLSTSRFSLVVQAAPALDVKLPMTGLLIDEWVEVMPNPKETTGIVFQYDQPDAAPPQSILIAVPPDPDQPWNLWQLQQVLLETLDLARIRAIDPDTLDETGHYLPALYFATNLANDTVSTDFAKLK